MPGDTTTGSCSKPRRGQAQLRRRVEPAEPVGLIVEDDVVILAPPLLTIVTMTNVGRPSPVVSGAELTYTTTMLLC